MQAGFPQDRHMHRNENVYVIKNEGFKAASQVQYVSLAGDYREKGFEYTGALEVLQVIFSYGYLWENIRVKGGAYGAMCSFSRSGMSYFTSYRDPNLMETYQIYQKAADYVAAFDADERDMTKYLIGAIAKIRCANDAIGRRHPSASPVILQELQTSSCRKNATRCLAQMLRQSGRSHR